MRKPHLVPFIVAVLGLGNLAPAWADDAGGWHVIQDGQGRSLKVRLEGKDGERWLLRRQVDGKVFPVSPGFLSEADRNAMDSAAMKLETEVKKLNELAGFPMFSGTPWNERKGEDVAKAMKLPQESTSKYTSSWRRYAQREGKVKLFGAMPFSTALYADQNGNVTSLSAVYANKGDFGSKAGFGEDHFKGGTDATEGSLAAAMAKDESAIRESLTQVLGAPVSQRYGEGKTRGTIYRWNWNGHAMLLSAEEGEAVTLTVVATEFADAGGKTARLNDKLLRDRLTESLEKAPNGDVFIRNIPMVDQGPKGYCVPATFERVMRFMGIDTDMYLLAMIGESSAGGGTSIPHLMEGVNSQLRRKGRRAKEENLKELRVKDVKRAIDAGIPVMWQMHAADLYGKLTNENTSKRKKNADMQKPIAREIGKQVDGVAKPSENGHCCMIIGYNEETQELAVSDSWGPSFEIRWTPIEVANWAHNQSIFMILP